METRELAQRTANGITVSLVWYGLESLAVLVEDAGSGERFELPVGPDEALDAFNHPFAYAAFRGLDLVATLEPLRL
jgi:hypothetical protein